MDETLNYSAVELVERLFEDLWGTRKEKVDQLVKFVEEIRNLPEDLLSGEYVRDCLHGVWNWDDPEPEA